MSKPYSIALFGGSFDPIHIGHVALLKKAISIFSFDKIILLPCKQSPHKKNAPIASDEDRLSMCQIATAHIDIVEVSDWEISESSEYSYTWSTVEYLKNKYPSAKLFFILGTDQWNVLHQWARYDYLKSELTFVVVKRQEEVIERADVKYMSVDFNNPVSSTLIRSQFSNESKPSGLSPSVLEFILSKGLYKK